MKPAATGPAQDPRTAPEAVGQERRGRRRYGGWRLATLTGAFLLIAVNPFLNFYFHWNFVQGWYQSLGIGNLWFVSPLEGLESLLIAKTPYGPSIVGMVIPVAIALLLGRVFCSWLCPISFVLELVDRVRRRLSGRPALNNKLIIARKVLWFTLIAELLASLILGAPLFVFLSPPGLIGREIMMAVFFKKLAIEGILIIAILLLELLTRRFFCRTFCPLGGLLAFLGRNRKLRVQLTPENCSTCGKCARHCPMALDPTKGESTLSYCWNCGECVDACRHCALEFRWR